jgi:Ca-activated chloride channel family protein
MNELLGLLTKECVSVPLLGVKVEGDILGRGARVRVSQRFRNNDEKAIEAVYKFPLPEGAAICGFSANIDGKVVTGQVEEREKAFEEYDNALAEGHGGYLLDEERPNIFTLSVGNLKPGSEAGIQVEYLHLSVFRQQFHGCAQDGLVI